MMELGQLHADIRYIAAASDEAAAWHKPADWLVVLQRSLDTCLRLSEQHVADGGNLSLEFQDGLLGGIEFNDLDCWWSWITEEHNAGNLNLNWSCRMLSSYIDGRLLTANIDMAIKIDGKKFTPKRNPAVSDSLLERARQLRSNGDSDVEISRSLGISRKTLNKRLGPRKKN